MIKNKNEYKVIELGKIFQFPDNSQYIECQYLRRYLSGCWIGLYYNYVFSKIFSRNIDHQRQKNVIQFYDTMKSQYGFSLNIKLVSIGNL